MTHLIQTIARPAVTVFAILLMTTGLALAQEAAESEGPISVSANITLASEYVFRGVTQSDENPAIQGGIDLGYDAGNDIGLYLGLWASNVDFNDDDEATIETDLYGGINYAFGDFIADAGFIYYAYPGAEDSLNYDFWELQGKLTYNFDFASVTGSINYSPDYFGGSGDSMYYKLAASVPLPLDLTLNAYAAHQDVDDNTAFVLPDYTDWGVGLAYSYEGFDFGVNYIDTDMSKSECADGCEARVVFSISKKF